jgi:hypothetical protein
MIELQAIKFNHSLGATNDALTIRRNETALVNVPSEPLGRPVWLKFLQRPPGARRWRARARADRSAAKDPARSRCDQ